MGNFILLLYHKRPPHLRDHLEKNHLVHFEVESIPRSPLPFQLSQDCRTIKKIRSPGSFRGIIREPNNDPLQSIYPRYINDRILS